MVKFSVVINAGGKSSRMGRDKGLLPFGEGTMLSYILDQIAGLGTEQIIISNQPEDYEQFGLPVYPDVIPEIGALGGVYSALHYSKNPYSLLLACDMPFVNLPLIEAMLAAAPNYDVVIPRLQLEGFAEPFRAVYAKACFPHIKKVIDQGKRRVISFFPAVSIRYIERAEILRVDPDELSFFNVNTPEDLEEAIRLANHSARGS